jgi:hypothetical protein
MLKTRKICIIYFPSKVEVCSKLGLIRIFFMMDISQGAF